MKTYQNIKSCSKTTFFFKQISLEFGAVRNFYGVLVVHHVVVTETG